MVHLVDLPAPGVSALVRPRPEFGCLEQLRRSERKRVGIRAASVVFVEKRRTLPENEPTWKGELTTPARKVLSENTSMWVLAANCRSPLVDCHASSQGVGY